MRTQQKIWGRDCTIIKPKIFTIWPLSERILASTDGQSNNPHCQLHRDVYLLPDPIPVHKGSQARPVITSSQHQMESSTVRMRIRLKALHLTQEKVSRAYYQQS